MKQNKLKIGERVKIYGSKMVDGAIVTIKKIADDRKRVEVVFDDGYTEWGHYRNCFKIKPKKKYLELYCAVTITEEGYVIFELPVGDKQTAERTKAVRDANSGRGHTCKVVKFREVQDK